MNKICFIVGMAVVFCVTVTAAFGEEREVRFHIKGLDCARSEMAFAEILNALEGIGNITTDVAEGTADVVFDDEKTGVEKMTTQIEKGEFKVKSSEMLR